MTDQAPLNTFLIELTTSPRFAPQLVCHRQLPARSEQRADPGVVLPERLADGLRALGINGLYSHQAQAIEGIRAGEDVIVATPTASGKSLIYNLPVLEHVMRHAEMHALYLFPLKALAQDQQAALAKLHQAVLPDSEHDKRPFSAIYDGDTSLAQRGRLRKRTPPVLISNPDMLHRSLLPYHDSWSLFFRTLRYVVLDEVHTYRGLFGAHLAWVLQRLQRIAAHYGARPQFILLSATIGNPGSHGAKLIGRQPLVIDQSGAPAAEKHMLFLNPWDSAAHATSQLLERACQRGLRTIVYTKSRKMTELITMWTKPRLGGLAAKLSSYRAGFLPEDRREIERNLTNGTLLAVISTSALELGIDIGDLDLCILVGYPGSIMATWQRSGRVGRGSRSSAVILVAGEDALDQYFMQHPGDFFDRSPEHATLDHLNSRISGQHLQCAAAELPLHDSEPFINTSPQVRRIIDTLTDDGLLHREYERAVWHASRKRPQRLFDLRGGGMKLSIIERTSGEIIGEIDASRALHETHPGAVYLHQSQTLLVEDLNRAAGEVLVVAAKPPYYTRPSVRKETAIIERQQETIVHGIRICRGNLRVTETVTGYRKINQFTGTTITTIPLDLPEQVIETEGLWLNLPQRARHLLEDRQLHFMGAIHALEHALIAMFPLLILCDRNDIGGISCQYHEQTERASIFIYDGYAGGAGLTRQAFELIEALLEQTERCIAGCRCEHGCPSCVHSPRCGSGNRPIDKGAALELLQAIRRDRLADPDLVAGPAEEQAPLQLNQPAVASPQIARGMAALPEHWCVFDLETKYSAEEVGGWQHCDQMGMSVGVVYDSRLDGYVTYLESEVQDLVTHLSSAELVVGFNIIQFDYRVLAGCSGRTLTGVPTYDLLTEIKERLGYRLSLGRLAEQTLGRPKSADGLQALRWYREGRIREIVDYCRIDVELTKDLFLFALTNGYVLFTNKAGATVRLPMGCAFPSASPNDGR